MAAMLGVDPVVPEQAQHAVVGGQLVVIEAGGDGHLRSSDDAEVLRRRGGFHVR